MYRMTTNTNDIRNYFSGASVVAWDFETAPDAPHRDEEKAALDAHRAHIVGVSFSTAEVDGIYVPLAHNAGDNVDRAEMLGILSAFATDPGVIKVAHNLAFEAMFLYALGIVIQPPCYDTIAAAQLTMKGNMTFRRLTDSGLKLLAASLLGASMTTYDAVTDGRHFDDLDPADTETIRYACADSDYTLRLYHLFNAWFDRYLPKHRRIVEQVESPTAVYCGIMRYNGLLMDTDAMREKKMMAAGRMQELRERIAGIIGAVDIGANASTSAFKKYLFNTLQLPVMKTTTKHQEAADDETMILLTEWCEANRPELVPLFEAVQEYRRLGKISSTYVEGYLRYVNTVTGRIHPDLMPLGTETGRFAARNPNLQNCPRKDNDPIGVRGFIVAPEGHALLSLDFSQIELRVGAFYCRDARMLETYRKGGDIHDQTATVIFGPGKHNKEQRTIAKNVNFGTFFGLFPRGLQKTLKFKAGLDVTLEQCEKIIRNIKTGYPRLTKWQEETIARATHCCYSETWLGRRRYLPGITSEEWSKRSYAERCALNSPIQGAAADTLKLALGRIVTGLPDRMWLRPLLQIHDELLFEVPVDKLDEAIAFVRACMEAQPFDGFDVPIIADAASGPNFGEMTEME